MLCISAKTAFSRIGLMELLGEAIQQYPDDRDLVMNVARVLRWVDD